MVNLLAPHINQKVTLNLLTTNLRRQPSRGRLSCRPNSSQNLFASPAAPRSTRRQPSVLTRPSPLWSTSFKVLHTSVANANFFLVPCIDASIPAIRISVHNTHAGNQA